MSIATQIQRLINAKNKIKTSLTNKSVVVADDVKLDSYDSLVNQIGANSNIGPADVIKGKVAFGNNGQYFNGTALSIQTSANNAKILKGFTAYDNGGQLLTGTALSTATNANSAKIFKGFTAYDNGGNLITGAALPNATNATNAQIMKGYSAYTSSGGWLIGTAFGSATNATNAQILSGQTAYLNNGLLLNGTMANWSDEYVNATNINVTSTSLRFYSSVNGYVDTTTRYNNTWNNIFNATFAKGLNMGRIGYEFCNSRNNSSYLSFYELPYLPRGYIITLEPATTNSEIERPWGWGTVVSAFNMRLTDPVDTTHYESFVGIYGGEDENSYVNTRLNTLRVGIDYYEDDDCYDMELWINNKRSSGIYFNGNYRLIYWY